MRYYYIPNRLVKMKNTENTHCQAVEKLSHKLLVQVETGEAVLQDFVTVFLKLNMNTLLPATPFHSVITEMNIKVRKKT